MIRSCFCINKSGSSLIRDQNERDLAIGMDSNKYACGTTVGNRAGEMPAANYYYFEFQKWNNLCKFIESISLILLYFLLRDIYQIRLYLGLTWLCYN